MQSRIHQRAGSILMAACLGCALLSAPAAAATFTVSIAGDNGDGACDESCTLRDAVAAAESSSGADVVEIAPGIDPLLSQPDQITLTTEVTIRGQGAEETTISGNDNSRIFEIAETGIVTIEDVTLTDGRAPDGASGQPGSPGGGIVNLGTLSISNVTLSGNRAGDGSGVAGEGGRGGAIINVGTLSIAHSVLTGNRAGNGADGGGGDGGDGGAIYNAGVLVLNTSTLSGNTAGTGGIDNFGSPGGDGGAIFNTGDLTVNDSTLSDNVAGTGGPGAGINGVGGTGGSGGALDNSGTFTLANSTLSGNAAGVGGSANTPGAVGTGGAIRSGGSGTSSIIASTVAGNTAGRLGGAFNLPEGDGSLTLINTLVAENTTDDETGNCFAVDLAGDLIDGGGNLDDGETCGFGASSLSNTPAGLDPAGPADNGGPTQTLALVAGSAAIDRGDDAECLDLDQRGVLRGLDGVGDGSGDDLDGGCDIGAFEAGGLAPDALAVDAGGNGVLESGEAVEVAPAWRDAGAPIEGSLVSGTASGLTGPGGAGYELLDGEATYPAPPFGATTDCRDAGDCHAVRVTADGGRPAAHWDASFVEVLDAGPSTHTWTLHVGDSFTDVPREHLFYRSIETALHHGITAGCTASDYCPAGQNTRAQLPVFVLRALLGPGHTPSPCVDGEETFTDVPFDSLFCPWIEELVERGVVSGCGDDIYCPNAPVTRAQMAIFLLKTLLGSGYTPPECTGAFDDVLCPSLFADWIEDLATRGITSGCTETDYCPSAAVNRGQMAVFVAKTFGLSLYGP